MDDLEQVKNKLCLDKITRHIFLCADQAKPKCCSLEQGVEVWNYLKNRLKELNLTCKTGIFRTKANCLRVCKQGPILVIYPEGIWYHSVSINILEKIIQEHVINGRLVKEYVLARPCPS